MKAFFMHPNGQVQEIDTPTGEVWVHPKAKKDDFGWSPKKKGLYSVKATELDADYIAEFLLIEDAKQQGKNEADCDCDALEDAQEAAYQRGYRDAIANCFVPGATIEMAARVIEQARMLGL